MNTNQITLKAVENPLNPGGENKRIAKFVTVAQCGCGTVARKLRSGDELIYRCKCGSELRFEK